MKYTQCRACGASFPVMSDHDLAPYCAECQSTGQAAYDVADRAGTLRAEAYLDAEEDACPDCGGAAVLCAACAVRFGVTA